MRWLVKVLCVILTLGWLFSLSFAQQVASSAETRSLLVNVFDRRGNVVRDLAKEDLRVRLNGKPVVVLNARYSLAPRRIVVLFDMSGSMTGNSAPAKWKITREALEDLLAQAPGDVPIAMLTFSGEVQQTFDFAQGRTAISQWLKGLSPKKPNLKYPAKTALFDAILEGLKLLQPFQAGDSIYAITDGDENASLASIAQLRTDLLNSGVRLFAFLFAEPIVPSEQQERKDAFLKFVQASGGFGFPMDGHPKPFRPSWEFDYVYDKSNQERIKAYTQALNLMVNCVWIVEVSVPLSAHAGRVKLEIVDQAGRVRENVGVNYPHTLLLAH